MDDAIVVALSGVAVLVTLVVVLVNCVCGGNDNGKKKPPGGREDNLNNNRGRSDEANGTASDPAEPSSVDQNSKRITLPRRELPKIPDGDVDRPRSVYETISEVQSAGRPHSELSLAGPCGANNDSDERLSNDRDSDTDIYEPCPPPVPDKVFPPTAIESGGLSTPGPSGVPSNAAASAVAGRFSAGSIPYMTSPVVPGSLEMVYDADAPVETEARPSGYDFLSVRVRATDLGLRQQADRTASQSDTQQEQLYSVVQDDGDQMYAEIQSAQNSAASSVTYSKIDPPIILEPPAPPTVESLRSVAYSQSHSRNASSSSFTSDNEFPHSPVSDRSLGAAAIGGATVLDLSDLYSTVDKSKKTRERASVHVMEGPPALDDLYAQVHKVNKGHHSLSANRHSPAASTGARPKLYNFSAGGRGSPQEVAASTFAKPIADTARPDHAVTPTVLRRNSSTDDPRYEKINEDRRRSSRPGDHHRADEQVALRRGVVTNDDDDVSEVGYETVKIPVAKVGGYETIGGDADNYEEIVEPNYEIVKSPKRLPVDADDDPGDPGYERIVNGSATGSTFVRGADPNYESVRYDRKSAPAAVNRCGNDSATVEPRYWLIDGGRRPDNDDQDPFYERISNRDEDAADPNYEKVKTVSELSSESSEPGYESVKKKPATSGAVLQEEGYAKVQDSVTSEARAATLAQHHGYEKLTKVGSPRTPVVRQDVGAPGSSDARVYADSSPSVRAVPSDGTLPDGTNLAMANHVGHEFSQNKILEDSLQDDVLL